MRPMYGSFVSAPSSSLLWFLRSQSQDICFFTPNSKSAFCHHCSLRPSQPVSCRHDTDRYRSTARSFTTSRRHQATVEASLLNLDFLRQSPKQSYTQTSSEYHTLLRRLWHPGGSVRASGRKPDDLRPLPGSSILSRSKVGKPLNAHILRCTEVNENGDVTLLNEQFKKSELIAKVGNYATTATKRS